MNQLQRYLLMSLDPVHVGMGGYRLGRVDLSIVREPGTRLPKIPGTSWSGAVRQYAAYRYEKPTCAGQAGHCRESTCPICYTFGYATGDQGGHQGTVALFDAHILLFPVHTMAGPVWVSTSGRLAEYGFAVTGDGPTDTQPTTTVAGWDKPLNLGWLMLDAPASTSVTTPENCTLTDDRAKAWQVVKGRLVLVTDKVFSQVVNSNLEVRTSVSIDPQTGAAAETALFTYEALPRATWLVCDVVEDEYRNDDKKPWTQERAQDLGWTRPLDVVKAGLEIAEMLGLGGMGTRGFGRVRLMGDWTITPKEARS